MKFFVHRLPGTVAQDHHPIAAATLPAGIAGGGGSTSLADIDDDLDEACVLGPRLATACTHCIAFCPRAEQQYMRRLVALLIEPRLHLIRFYGVLGQNAELRTQAVPQEPKAPAREAKAAKHHPRRQPGYRRSSGASTG